MNMKKTICFLLSALLLAGMIGLPAAAEGEPAFQVSTAEAKRGEQVSLTVSTLNNPGIASFELYIIYDENSLEWVDVARGGFDGNWDIGVDESALWIDAENHTDDAVILTLAFKVKETAPEGLATVSVSYESGNIFDEDANDVEFNVISGGVMIKNQEEEETTPEFKTQNLVLSGQIGVNFFLDLSGLSEAERNASYMEFSISGKGARTTTDPFDPNHMNASRKYYGFTCYVQSIQMADTITATFHYGDGNTVRKIYSVDEYFGVFEEHAGENDEKTVALIHAIADYGHYMQIYLASVNHFDIGTDYAESYRQYTESYDYADILSKVEFHAIMRSLDESRVEKANYRLQLGSETTLDVFLKTTDGSAPTNVTVTIDEVASGITTTISYTPVKQADGRYLVTIPNISAHRLGDKVTVTGKAGGSFTVVVSPLSFVRDVLKNETATESLDGLSAFYAYYAAAIAYKG